MRKALLCCIVLAFCLLSVAAYADETTVTPSPTMEVIPSIGDDPTNEELALMLLEDGENVDDPVNTEEPGSVSGDETAPEATDNGDSGDSDNPDPTATPEPTASPSPTPTTEPVESSPFPVETGEAIAVIAEATSSASYDEQTLQVLGNIQAYLLFFVVVVLLYFSYKFLRMFF